MPCWHTPGSCRDPARWPSRFRRSPTHVGRCSTGRDPRSMCVARIARVALGPRFQRSSLPFQVPREVAVVQCFDVEALGVAGPIAQLVGLEQALSRERRLSHPP